MSWLLLPALLIGVAEAPQPEAPPPPPAQQDQQSEQADESWEQDSPPVDPGIIEGRQRPGYTAPLPEPVVQNNEGAIRADRIVVPLGNRQVRLRYVNCPFAPFLDTAAQNVCEGL